MCWYGECSFLRQWKQPFILDRISWRTGRFTTNFEETLSLLNTSPSWKRSVSDSMDKCRSTCPLRLRTVPGKDERKQRCNYKMWRSSGRIQNVPFRELLEKQLNSSGIFSQDSRHCRFFRRSRVTCENRTSGLKYSQVGSSSCQWLEKGNDGIWISNSEKVKEYAKRFSRGHWTSLGPGDEKELFLTHLKENEILQPVKWWNDSKIQVIQYSGVLVLLVVKFWKRRKAETPYTSIRMLRTPNSYSGSFIL